MKFVLIEKVLVQGLQFLQGILLARMLCPEDFGLTAMLGIFLGIGACLAESGLGTAYVVYGGDTRRYWRWNVGAAVVVYLVLSCAAPWIAAWYGKPILRELCWVMGVGLILNAASVVGMARLQREEKFATISTLNVLATCFAFAVGVLMAWQGFGTWSIVGVGLTYAVVRLVGVMGERVKGEKRRESREEKVGGTGEDFGMVLKYGWRLMASGLVHVVYIESYNLILGKLQNPSVVGLFVRGRRWAQLPGDVVNDSVGRVALPKMVVEQGERANGGWVGINCLLLYPGLVVLWIWAEAIVELVLGPQWLDCVPYLRILLIGQFFTPFSNIALQKIRARGRSDLILVTDAWKKPIGLVAMLVGLPFGVIGLCWAKVVDDIVEAVVDWWVERRG